jgi:hypothetical protein
VERFCKHYSKHGQDFLLSSELVDYVWELTNGHPAGVRTLLEGLICSEVLRPFRKTPSEISLDTALRFLGNDETLFSCVASIPYGFNRGLPIMERESLDAVRFLREVLASGRSEDNCQSNPALNTCYRKGWLQAELSGDEWVGGLLCSAKTVYVFPSMLHRR